MLRICIRASRMNRIYANVQDVSTTETFGRLPQQYEPARDQEDLQQPPKAIG